MAIGGSQHGGAGLVIFDDGKALGQLPRIIIQRVVRMVGTEHANNLLNLGFGDGVDDGRDRHDAGALHVQQRSGFGVGQLELHRVQAVVAQGLPVVDLHCAVQQFVRGCGLHSR